MGIDEIIKDFNKKHKTDLITRGQKTKKLSRIDFSSPRANYMLRGGIPEGRMIEFAGEQGSGKTTTALDIIANAQTLFADREKGNKILFVDVEGTLDCEWAKTLGVDTDDLFIFVPDNQPAEIILQIVEDMVETGEFGLVVLDSITFLINKERMEKNLSDATVGGISKVWTNHIRSMTRLQMKYGFTYIAINAPRPKIGSRIPGQVYYPGGEQWPLACSVRLLFSAGETYDIDGKEQPKSYQFPVAHKIIIKLNKTKICPPDRKITSYVLDYKNGIDIVHDTIEAAEIEDLIEKSGSWYNYGDIKVQGKNGLKEYLEDNPETFNKLYIEVMERIKK